MPIEIFQEKTKMQLIHHNASAFCKQTLNRNHHLVSTIHDKVITTDQSKYETIVECSNDEYMLVQNINIGEKIIVNCIPYFSQLIHNTDVILQKENAYNIGYIVDNTGYVIQQDIQKNFTVDKEHIGKHINYRPQLRMVVTKIIIKNNDLKNSWILEAVETF